MGNAFPLKPPGSLAGRRRRSGVGGAARGRRRVKGPRPAYAGRAALPDAAPTREVIMTGDRTAAPWPRRVIVAPGVYPPQDDTRVLMRAVRREGIGPGTDVLDAGTGSGALAVCAARLGARVTAVDIGWRAVLCARLNAMLAGQRVTVRRRDLSAPEGMYDMVISNPPYVPAPGGRLPRRGPARAWDAGSDGRAVVDQVCASAARALRPHGVLLMVHSGLCGPEATLRRLAQAGLRVSVSDRELVPFGPVLRSRLDWLRAQGLVGECQDREELVVIRAEHF
jgi:release factor glutamine methyltransferase